MKTAIVGAGQIAEAHIVEISNLDMVEVVALCDLYESPLLALQEQYAIPYVGTDLDEMLDQTRPDVVHITTPPVSQLGIARRCLEAGTHVYIEKPMTTSLAETKALLQCADRCRRKVYLGANRNFGRSQHAAIQMIENGELGAITHMEAVFSYDLHGIFGRQVLSNPEHWIAKLPGQVFQNNLNHPLAAIVPFLSDDLEVRACAADWSGNGIVFDELRVEIIDKTNRRSAYLVFTSNIKPGMYKISYLGREKALVVDGVANTLIVAESSKLPGTLGHIMAIREAAKQLSKQFRQRLFRFVSGRESYFEDMQFLFRAVYESVANDTPPPIPYEQVVRASRIMDEIIRQVERPERDAA